jgi:hypothetical protein
MFNKFRIWLKNWWRKHIVDECPPHLEEYEYGDKWKNLNK